MSVVVKCTCSPKISEAEKEVLIEIKKARRYPVARFELRSSREDDLISTALNHVCLKSEKDSMETVKAKASLLSKLEEKGLIEISYNLRCFIKSDYSMYHHSDLFALLCNTVEEGKKKENFLFDYAFLKKGIITLTLKGEYAVK